MRTFGEPQFAVNVEARLLFLCPATALLRRERRFTQLTFSSIQDLMCCHGVYGVALDVHKCMKIAGAAFTAVAAARQQPRRGRVLNGNNGERDTTYGGLQEQTPCSCALGDDAVGGGKYRDLHQRRYTCKP
jgi:hypothetical protein